MEGREEERPRARVFLSLCKLDPILDHNFTTPGRGSQEEPEPREEAHLHLSSLISLDCSGFRSEFGLPGLDVVFYALGSFWLISVHHCVQMIDVRVTVLLITVLIIQAY